MRRVLLSLIASVVCGWVVGQPMPMRSNVIPYDDELGIAKVAYRESPYYMELTGSWKQRRTDSSTFYTKEVKCEKTWRDYAVSLSVRCGKATRLWVDDAMVGYADDSRAWNEFAISKYLHYGKPITIAIEALDHSRGELLEEANIPCGLNGIPYLIFKSDPGVEDLTIGASYDAENASGTLTINATVMNSKRKGKYYLEVEILSPNGKQLDRMGRWVVFDKRSEDIVELSRSWNGVLPWSAEMPVLYTAIVRLRDENMDIEEVVGARFGFRTVEVREGLLCVNGKAITLKGIVYGVEHTEGYAGREQLKRDVLAMKRQNINAVRTARYSPLDSYFYELCDQYGLYVICDANLMPASTQQQVVATDQDFMPMFEHRVENLYGAYKNYTSIVAWSLGNTKDNGVCMAAAYRRLKAIEKMRPVVFAGADYGEATDIISPMYPNDKTLKQAVAKPSSRPIISLALVGENDFPSLESLWNIIGANYQLQGGFVDVWPLTGIQQSELNHLFRPFDARLVNLTKDEGEFAIYNNNDFRNLSEYLLDYIIYTNRRTNIIAGDLPTAIKGGESERVTMRIPQLELESGEELFIRFNLKERRDGRMQTQSLADASTASVVFSLPQRGVRSVPFSNDGTPFDNGDTIVGQLLHQLIFIGHEDWKAELVDQVIHRPDDRTKCSDAMWRFRAADGMVMCDVRTTYTEYSTGDVVVDYTIAPSDEVRHALRPAVQWLMPIDSIVWFGLDREVVFSSSNSGIPGTFHQKVGSLLNREQVRWCTTTTGPEHIMFRVPGQLFSYRAVEDGLTVIPPASNQFRLHLHRQADGISQSLAVVDFPTTSVGILEPPVITASAARFSQPIMVELTAQAGSIIRYTLDGSEPTEESMLYSKPIDLSSTTVVKARAFAQGMPPSFTSTKKFNYDYIVRTTFSRRPSNPYNIGADTLLFDGELGYVDDLNHAWVGFSGGDVVTTVELSKPIDVDQLTLRFAHSPKAWAFAPRSIQVVGSADGINYGQPITLTIPFDPSLEENAEPRVVELTIPIQQQAIGFLRISTTMLGQIPSWHRGKGLKPWLLMDEISVGENTAKE